MYEFGVLLCLFVGLWLNCHDVPLMSHARISGCSALFGMLC